MADENFFDGLDDAEDVPAPALTPEAAAPVEVAKPEVAEKPAEKAPEAKAAEKPAEKAPEVVVPPAAEKPPEKPVEQPDPRKWVPVGAHVELRNQMKAIQDELNKLKNPPPAKPAEPDFVQDPKAYVDHRVNAALEQLETGTKAATQTAEQANAQAERASFQMALNTAESSFVTQQPDYHHALDHVRNVRFAELSALHPDVPEADLRAFMGQEEIQLAANILRSGRNPAQVAYALAKARGYAPKPPPERKPAPAEKVAELLPKVPEPVKLAPDLTLGTGMGSPITGDVEEDPFDAAFKEMFGRKRA